MKLHHIAIWTFRLEELKDFYVRFLGGRVMKNTSIRRKDSSPISSLSEKALLWN